jgi:hypothetical protein
VADKSPVHVNRNERILAYMLVSAIGLSIVAIVAVIAGTGLGVRDFDEGIWPVVVVLPTVGLPIGFILVAVLLVVSATRRSRSARNARH